MIFALLLVAWSVLIIFLIKKRKLGENLTLFGPALMIKTKKGRRLIERAGSHKIWRYFGDFSICISVIMIVGVFLLLLWQAILVVNLPPSSAPSPVEAIGIPGINPVIPIGYGIIGLVVAIVVHELAHGLLIANQKMKIVSLGILLFIIPIGAFVEPDEEELKNVPRKKRMRVFAAGPTTNLIIALIALLLFVSLISGISPRYSGMYVAASYEGGPNAGIIPVGAVLLSINNVNITDYDDFYSINAPLPGDKVNVTFVIHDKVEKAEAWSGVVITYVSEGYPAYESGIKPGWIIYSINGTVIRNEKEFFDAMNTTRAGETVEIKLFKPTNMWMSVNVTLADKYEYFEKYAPQYNKEWYRGKGFLGVNANYLGIVLGDANYLKNILSNPLYGADNPSTAFRRLLLYIALPFAGLMPLPSDLAALFNTPFTGFWFVANALYWVFWLNLMLGMTNLLPAIPLDGGYVLRDFIDGAFEKIKIRESRKAADIITALFSFSVLFLILWQFIAPRFI